ncbi:MAG: tetratricopeptide repeat protein [Pseudomonadota bacterium]
MSDNNEHASSAAYDHYDTYADNTATVGADNTGTEDLKSILKLITTQLQDVDRRQTEVLSQMQQRLEDLEGQTKARKARVPAAYVPAFERIQEGIHQLVERISENREAPNESLAPSQQAMPQHNGVMQHGHSEIADHGDVAENAPAGQAGSIPALSSLITDALSNQEADGPEAFTDNVTALSTAQAVPGETDLQASSEAMPLRSALNEDELGQHAEDHRSANSDVDAFEMVEADLDMETSDPWDAETAEALTQSYEDGEADAPQMVAGIPTLSAAPLGASSQEANAAPTEAQPVPLAVDFDRNWLQERFSEIADRVEQSMADMRPDDSLFALSDRVERMQDDITEALRDVATRDDLDTLKPEEFPIDDLLSHLDRTDAKLDRIASVDDKLAMVIAQLSDERFNAMISEFAPTAPVSVEAPEVDFDKVANVAAAAVAERFASLGEKENEQAPAVNEMRELLEHFIADQRKDHEQTAGALDTIQQAMVNILDRVEAMEMSSEAAAMVAPEAGLLDEDYPTISTSPKSANAAFAAPLIEPQTGGLENNQDYDLADDDAQEHAMPDHAGADETSGVIAPDLPAMSPIDRIRQDFIDDARRAKAQASAKADAETAKGNQPKPAKKSLLDGLRGRGKTAEAQSHSAGVEAVLSGSQIEDGETASTIFGMRRNTVMIGAFVTLIAVTSALMLMRKDRPFSATPGQPVIERTISSPTQPPHSRLQSHDIQGQSSNPAYRSGERSEIIDGSTDKQHSTNTTTRGPVASLDHVPGVDIQPARRALSAPELAHIEERRSMAQASSKLGQEAARATPAAVMKEFGVSSNGGLAQSAVQRSGMASKLDLPPATVGPLSLRLAAAKGDPSAQFEVAARLAEGKGTSQNFADAVRWYSMSANQGFAQSMYRLGTMFERGLGVKKDLAKAASHYEQAADRGNVKAMHNLAVLKAGSSTTSPDYLSAAHWFAKAADYGLTDSQYNLAVLFENGLGVKKDLIESYKFYTLSAKSGDAEAIKRRDAVRSELTSKQSMAAEQLIAKWRPKVPSRIANDARAAGEEWKKRASGQYAS